MPQQASQEPGPGSPTNDAGLVLDPFGAADYELDLHSGALRPSPRLNLLCGFPPDYPLTQADCRAACHPEDRGVLAKVIAAAAAGAPRFQHELRIMLADGSLRWLLSRGEVLFDAAGQPALVRGVAIDITERKRVEAALRQSEERHTFLLRLSDALRPVMQAGAILALAARLLGEQLRASRVFFAEVEPDDEHAVVAQGYDASDEESRSAARLRLADYGLFVVRELRANRPAVIVDTELRVEEAAAERAEHRASEVRALIAFPIVRAGRLAAILGVIQSAPRRWNEDEVTLVGETAERAWAGVERVRTEVALRDSEIHLAAVFEQAQVGISEIAADGHFLRVNAALCRILGRSREELLAATIADVTLADDLPQSQAAVARLFATGGPLSLDKRYVRPDGTLVWANSALALVTSGTPAPIILAVTVDMTERRKAEAARRESAVLRRLAAAQEEERLRIARDLHDQLGQQITGLLLGLKQLAGLAGGTPLAALLPSLQAIALDLAKESHRLAVNLRPTALEDFGLVPALERHVTDWSAQSAIPAAFQSHGPSRHRLPRPIEVGLFRVVQEALTNVRKHAQATRVGVIVRCASDQVVVVVEDDGRGFDVDAIGPDGERPQLGLLGIRERVAQLGGTLELETAPGGGTTIFVRIPLGPDDVAFDPAG